MCGATGGQRSDARQLETLREQPHHQSTVGDEKKVIWKARGGQKVGEAGGDFVVRKRRGGSVLTAQPRGDALLVATSYGVEETGHCQLLRYPAVMHLEEEDGGKSEIIPPKREKMLESAAATHGRRGTGRLIFGATKRQPDVMPKAPCCGADALVRTEPRRKRKSSRDNERRCVREDRWCCTRASREERRW